MRPLVVVALDERVESRLLLQHVGRRRLRRFGLQRQVHPLVAAVLFGMPGAIRSRPMPSRSHHTASLLRP